MAGEGTPPTEPRKIIVRKGYKKFVSYPDQPDTDIMNVSDKPPEPNRSPVEAPPDPQREQALSILSVVPKGDRQSALEQLKTLGISPHKIGFYIALSGRDDLA